MSETRRRDLIDIDDPDLEHVADADDFVRIANEAVGQAADVHQAAVGQADIDEDAEIDDVEDRARTAPCPPRGPRAS